jgi:hypothetical protein
MPRKAGQGTLALTPRQPFVPQARHRPAEPLQGFHVAGDAVVGEMTPQVLPQSAACFLHRFPLSQACLTQTRLDSPTPPDSNFRLNRFQMAELGNHLGHRKAGNASGEPLISGHSPETPQCPAALDDGATMIRKTCVWRVRKTKDFWRMIRQRRSRGKSFPLAEVETRLETPRRKPARKRVSTNKARKH